MALANIPRYTLSAARSFGYVAIDIFADMNPTVKGFIQSNEEIAKTTYESIKDYKGTAKKVKKAVKESTIMDFSQDYVKNFIKDLRSGKLYNREREDKYLNRMYSAGDDDWGDMNVNDGWGDTAFDNDDEWGISDSDKIVNGFDSIAAKIEKAAAFRTEKASIFMATEQRQNTKNIANHQEALFNRLNFAVDTLNSSMTAVTSLIEPLNSHMKNSQQYFTTMTDYGQRITAILDKIEASTGTIATVQQSKERETIGYNEVVSGGIVDIQKYLGTVTKNIDNAFSGIKSLNSAFGEGTSMLSTFAASPIKPILEATVKSFIPKALSSGMEVLNESLSGFFGSSMMKLNNFRHIDDDVPEIFKSIGKIFSVDDKYKNTITTSMYEKGRVNFDGMTRKAIIEVIPTQLAKIVSLLSGEAENRFNYELGKFQSLDDIRKQRDDLEKDYAGRASAAIKREFDKYMDIINFRDYDQKKRISAEMDAFFTKLYKESRLFDYNNKNAFASDYDISNDTFNLIKAMYQANEENGKGYLALQLNDRILKERQNQSKYLSEQERLGNTIWNALYNDSITPNKYTSDKYYKERNSLFDRLSIESVLDDKGHNMFYYLQHYYTSFNKLLGAIGAFNPSSNPIGGIGSSYNENKDLRYTVPISYKPKTREEEKSIGEKIEREYYKNNELHRINKWKDKGVSYIDFSKLDPVNDEEFLLSVRNAFNTNNRKDNLEQTLKDNKNSKTNKLFDRIRKLSANERFTKLTNKGEELAKSPSKTLKSIFDSVNKKLYQFIYGNGEKDERSFMNKMLDRLNDTFINYNKFLDEKILDPLAQKYDIHGFGDILHKIFNKLGVDTKSMIGEVRDTLFGVEGPNGREGGLFKEIGDSVKNSFKSAFDWIKDGFKNIFNPITSKIKDKWNEFKDIRKGKASKKEKSDNDDMESVRRIDERIRERSTAVDDRIGLRMRDAGSTSTLTETERLAQAIADKYRNISDGSRNINLFDYDVGARFLEDYMKSEEGKFALSKALAAAKLSVNIDDYKRNISPNAESNDPINRLRTRDFNSHQSKFGETKNYAKLNALLNDPLSRRSIEFFQALKNNTKTPIELRENQNLLIELTTKENFKYIKEHWNELLPNAGNIIQTGGDEYIKSVLMDNIDYIKQNKDKFIKSIKQELSILGSFDKARNESENIGKNIYDSEHGSLLSRLKTMIDNQVKQIDILNKLGSVNVKISEYVRGIGSILKYFSNGFNPNNIRTNRFGLGVNDSNTNNDIYDQDDIQDADVRDVTSSNNSPFPDILNNNNLLTLPGPAPINKREEEIDNNRRIDDIIYDNTKQEKVDRELIKFFSNDIYDQYYKGGEVKRTGIAAVSKGELIIPSELNPFYNGSTDKEKQKEEEDNAILKFFGKFAEGTTAVGDKNASKIGTRGLASIENKNYTEGEYNSILSKVLSGKYVLVSKGDKTVARINDNIINELGYSPAKDEKGNIVDEIYRDLMIDKLLNGDPSIGLRTSRYMNVMDKHKNLRLRDRYIEEGSIIDKILSTSDYTINRLFGDPTKTKQEDTKLKDITNDLIANSSNYAGPAIAGSLIGGGVSLITGMVGGPLLGAAVGGATALTLKSKVLNKALFGELGEDGKYKGGALGDELSTFVKTKFPGIAKGGAVGAITSLMPFVPGGPIAGLLVGSAIGYAKQSEDFKGFFFGEDGLFGKDTDKKIKEKLPAMGVGAAAGAFLGPFGFLGNLILGAGVGFASDTENFKNLVFGRKNDKGVRVGGVVGAVREGVIDPLRSWAKDTIFTTRDYFKEHVLKPMGAAFKPITRQIFLSIENLFTGISDKFNNWLNGTLGMPLVTAAGKVAKAFTTGAGKIANVLFAPVKFTASLPFRFMGNLGRHYQKKQIKSGTANYMDAAERMEFRRTHKMGKNDRFSRFDSVLQNMNKTDLTNMNSIISNIGKNDSLEKEAHNVSRDVANTLTNEMGYIYTRSGMQSFNNGDASELLANIQNSDLSDERKSELYKYVQEQHDKRVGLLSAARQGETVRSNAAKSLRQMGFRNFDQNSLKGKSLTHIQQLIEKEMKSNKMKDPTEIRVEQGKRELDILTKLSESMDAIRAATDPNSDFARSYNNERKRKNKETQVKFETDYRGNVHKYVVNKEGEYEEDTTDTDTRRARDEINDSDQRDEDIVRNTGALVAIRDAFSGVREWLFGKKEEDTEEGIFKKIARVAKGLTKVGLLTTGVGFAGAGAKYVSLNILPIIKQWWREDLKPYLQKDLPNEIHDVWIPKLENSFLGRAILQIPSIINRISELVGNGFNYIKDTAVPWVLGYGKYKNQGLPMYISQALAWSVPTILEGLTFAFETAGPAIVKSIVVTLPRLFKALAVSIGEVLFSGISNIFNNKKGVDTSATQIFDKVARVDSTLKHQMVKGSRFSEYIPNASIPDLSSIADKALSSMGIGGSSVTSLNDTIDGVNNTTINKVISDASASNIPVGSFDNKGLVQNQLLTQGLDPLSAKSIAFGSNSETELQANIRKYYSTNFGINDKMTQEQQTAAIEAAYVNGFDPSNNVVKGHDQSLVGTSLEAMIRSLSAPKSVQKAWNGAGKVAKGIVSLGDLTARGLSHVPFFKKPFKLVSAGTGLVKKLANPVIDIATDAPGFIAKSLAKLDNVANNITKTQTTTNLINKFVNKGALSGKEGLEKIATITKNNALKTNSMVAKIIATVTDGINKLMDCKQVQKVIRQITGKNADDVLKLCAKAASKISNSLGGLIKKVATKSSGLISKAFKALSGKVFFFVMLAADFISGMDRAESILGVTDPNLIETLIAGLVNAVTSQLTFGIIPTSSVVDVFVDTLLPMLNIDTSDLQKRRKEAEQALYEWNAANPDAQYDNIDDFLKKDDISTKIHNAASNVWSSIKNVFTNDDTSISVSRSGIATSKASNFGISNILGNGSKLSNLIGSGSMMTGIVHEPAMFKYTEPANVLSGGDSELGNKNTTTSVNTKNVKSSIVDDLIDKLTDIISGFLQTNVVYNTLRNALDIKNNRKKLASIINSAIDKLALLLRRELTHISSYGIRGGLGQLDKFLSFLGKKAFFWLDMALAFTSGIDRAESILGFENPGLGWTFIAGCICAFSELTAGILSPETMASILIDVFMPLFGMDTASLQKKKADAELAFKKWNEEHPDKQFATMKDYLSRNDIGTKFKNTISKFFGGGSFVSQFDPRFATKSFGGSNIAKEGCGPAVATMAINDITGRNINLGNAANYATMRGYTGSGTNIGYFKDIFANQGIASSYVNNKNDIMGALSRGHETVLLGRDASNRSKANSPFGPGSHYVLAKGLTPNGDIVVNDPESSLPNRIYKKSILNNVQAGVATGSGSMLQEAIAQISKYEGSHTSVNRNDVGALSIGKIQWHATRARDLLKEIEKAQPGILQNYLPSELADAVNSKDNNYWSTRILTASEASAMKQLLGTTASINTQNQLVARDVASYFNYPQSKGIVDPGALAAIADATNTAYAVGRRVSDNAIKNAGMAAAVNIEHVYQAIKNDSVASRAIYADRYASMYQKMRNMTSFQYDPEMDKQLGINTTASGLNANIGVNTGGTVVGGNNTENTTSTNPTDGSTGNSLLNLFGKLANSVLSELYGSKVISTIADFLGVTLPTNNNTPSSLVNIGNVNDFGYASSVVSTPIGSIMDRSSSGLLNLYKNSNVRYGDLVAETAKSYIDQVDYVYGARDIDNKMQADCSGFTQQIYKKFGYPDMQPTVTTQDADSRFQRIFNRSDLLPGDLVMIENDDNPANGSDHIGIYVGDGKFVHSPRTGFKVKISDLNTDYYNKHFDHGKRVPVPDTWELERNDASAQRGTISNYTDSGNGSGIIDPLQHYIKTSEQHNNNNTSELVSQNVDSSIVPLLESITNKLDNIVNNTLPINNIIGVLERIVSLKKNIGSGSKISDDVTTNLINKNYIINEGQKSSTTDNNDISKLTSLIGQLIM